MIEVRNLCHDVDIKQPLAASEWSLAHVDELGAKCRISERGGRFVISEIVEPHGKIFIYQEFLYGVINAYILAESDSFITYYPRGRGPGLEGFQSRC